MPNKTQSTKHETSTKFQYSIFKHLNLFLIYTKRGFSVVEFMVVLGIVLVITIAITRFSSSVISLNRGTQEGLRTQEQLRKTLAGIASELRNAQPSATGSYALAGVEAGSLVFYSDVTGDRIPERLHYVFLGGSLNRSVTTPSGAPLAYDNAQESTAVAAAYVLATTTPVFTYYDGTGSALSSPVDISRVRMVGISLTVDKDLNQPPGPTTESTVVTIRQLKDNL